MGNNVSAQDGHDDVTADELQAAVLHAGDEKRPINSDDNGKSHLHIASENGQLEIVKNLVQEGVNKEIMDLDGRTISVSLLKRATSRSSSIWFRKEQTMRPAEIVEGLVFTKLRTGDTWISSSSSSKTELSRIKPTFLVKRLFIGQSFTITYKSWFTCWKKCLSTSTIQMFMV